MSLALELFMLVNDIKDEDIARKVFTPHIEFYERLVDVLADVYEEAFSDGVETLSDVISDIQISSETQGSEDFIKGAAVMLGIVKTVTTQTKNSLSEFLNNVKTTGQGNTAKAG